MTAAGFYQRLPSALPHELKVAPWVVLDLETTAPTLYRAPRRFSSSTRIGSTTWMAYRGANPGISVNTRPRMRVLSVYTEALGVCAWDLDALTTVERQQLFDVVVNEKIVVAHNAGVDLSWLFTETATRPRFVLDSMLLLRHLRPGLLLRPFRTVVAGDDATRQRARVLIEQERGKPSASLEFIASALRLPIPDPNYQLHASWCVSSLSAPHHAYLAAGLDLPLGILSSLMPGISVEAMPTHIEKNFPWYIPFGTALIRLAEAHARGVPFDVEAAERLRSDCLSEIAEAANHLGSLPEYAGLRQLLADPHAGETNELKRAFTMHAAAHGVVLPPTGTGAVSSRQLMKEAGADKLPAWNNLEKLKSSKKALGTVVEYIRAAGSDGKLHSLVGFVATTGRTTSSEPSLQNMPRDPRFRALIKARSGHVILAADYASIELRIAAALAERAVADLRRHLNNPRWDDNWFLEQVQIGAAATDTLRCPPEPATWTLNWLRNVIPAIAHVVLRRPVQNMASVFDRGLDPHLVTAIDMARRQGRIDCGDDPVKWLAAQDSQALKDLKLQLQEERQAAKATNFGLLYGMGSEGLRQNGITKYGLSWTAEEASQARRAWFALYPEFQLWHLWTKYQRSRKVSKDTCAVWDFNEGKLTVPKYQIRLFEPSTLTGRPFAILGDFRQALNYQDQGSGADMLARAIAWLPEEVAAMLLVPVHDELVFEVPVHNIEDVKRLVEETMVRAGDAVVGGMIPVEVETVVGEVWRKA